MKVLGDGKLAGLFVLFVFSSLFLSAGAAELQNVDGSVWVNEDYNWSLEFRADSNYSYSNITVKNETLELEDDSISILSNTSERVNATLYRFNLNASEYANGETVAKLEAEAVNDSEVEFGFSGVPGIGNGRYELKVYGSVYKSFDSGGSVSWNYSDWSTENFTLVYNGDTSGPSISLSLGSDNVEEGGSVEVSCSSSDPSGVKSTNLRVTKPDGSSSSISCGDSFSETSQTGDYTVEYTATDELGNSASRTESFTVESSDDGGSSGSSEVERTPSSTHSWVAVNSSSFSFQPDQATEVQNITLETADKRSDFEVTVEKLSEKPETVQNPGNAHRYMDITVSAPDSEIEDTVIEFTVERSFVEGKDVVLSRYDGEWEDLPTRPVEQEGAEWVYEASSSGFSYYAVRAEEPENTGENGESGQETQNETETETGSETDRKENQTQQQQDDTEQEPGSLPVIPFLAGTAVLTVLAAAAYLGIGKYREKKLEKLIEEIKERIEEREKTEGGLKNSTEIYRLLEKAEESFRKDDYSKTEELLNKIEQKL